MIFAFVVLVSASLVAQTFRGTILGTVTDASGAVISGANVMVKNVDTGQERSTQTSADGSYSVPELPIGSYTVTISQSGFQTSVTTNVVVDVASERRVDASAEGGPGFADGGGLGRGLVPGRYHFGAVGRNPDRRRRLPICR